MNPALSSALQTSFGRASNLLLARPPSYPLDGSHRRARSTCHTAWGSACSRPWHADRTDCIWEAATWRTCGSLVLLAQNYRPCRLEHKTTIYLIDDCRQSANRAET